MSRPRPPLHDPYGLLRPPPPLESPRDSFYSVASSNLGSTVSLSQPPASPGRRNRQRGVSPSRTQHGEEYDDQPYLTNVVRHHGQVTLVPPVNQGRTRKIRRRRNPDAAASTTSLVEPSGRPVSAGGSSRLDTEAPTTHRSPRRPRHGSDTRALSSPDIHSSPYPDYPPPSFEEVLALDRAAAPNTPAQRLTEPTNTTPSPPSHISNSPPASPASPHPVPATTTAWEEDRRLGLSLEERVRRELERNRKPGVAELPPKPTIDTTSGPFPSSDEPQPLSSGTPTSVTPSNFLTPQNLTPSPLGIPLPLSSQASPQVEVSEPRPPTPPAAPFKSPPLGTRSIETPNLVAPQPAPSAKSHALGLLDQPDSTAGPARIFYSDKSVATPQQAPQTISQGSPAKSGGLAPLLFTAKLDIDNPSPVGSPSKLAESNASQGRSESSVPIPGGVKGKLKEVIDESPEVAPLLDRATTPRAGSPRKFVSQTTDPGEPSASNSHVDLTRKPPVPRRPISLLSPIGPSAEIGLHTPNSPFKSGDNQFSGSTLRKAPPPPPPRPRPRSVGAGIAARISAYEAILANAPKVPPPIPPRPRERQRADWSAQNPSLNREQEEGNIAGGHAITELLDADAHIPTINTAPPRQIGLLVPETGPSRPGSQQLPLNLTPSTRTPSPERPKSPIKQVQAQALVPARIGPDGKLEIIPDAEVIWLDESKAGVAEHLTARRERSGSKAQLDEQDHGVRSGPAQLVEPIAGPSRRRMPPPPPPIDNTSVQNTNQENSGPTEPIAPNPFSPNPSPVLQSVDTIEAPQPAPSPRLADDFEYTDLDLLISRLEENEAARQGVNYEQLLTVGEVLGPAVPRPRADLDLNVGLIEIQRRRVMKDGRVKLKLSLMGVSVDKCGICLTQFKASASFLARR